MGIKLRCRRSLNTPDRREKNKLSEGKLPGYGRVYISGCGNIAWDFPALNNISDKVRFLCSIPTDVYLKVQIFIQR